MRRMMIQADEALLERARRRAAERGVSVAQVVRDALERELADDQIAPPASSIAIVSSDAMAPAHDADAYAPDPWR